MNIYACYFNTGNWVYSPDPCTLSEGYYKFITLMVTAKNAKNVKTAIKKVYPDASKFRITIAGKA